MLSLSVLFFFCLGLIVGSFINVLVLRSGARALSGRSACMSCGAKIRWLDLIPVFSWLHLRGRCRACGSRISIQYPIVEFCVGILFALVGGAALVPLAKIIGLLISAVLVAIAVYDFRHTIIPDAWVWSFNALAFLSIFLFPPYSILHTTYSIFAGPAVALPLFALWLVSKGRWMGLGDPKLALGIGWLLGPVYGIASLFLAFILGAAIGLLLVFFSSACWEATARQFIPLTFWRKGGNGITMKSEVPFGPFLVASCLLVLFALMYQIPLMFIVL